MIKTIPTIPRLLAMVLFALTSFGSLLFLWLAFGGPIPLHAKGYRFNVMFPKAAQLTRQADVRISGVSVGKVVALEPGLNSTRATIELNARYAPIPKAARAMLRTKTLLGETYVELAPHRTAGTGPLQENGTLARASVKSTVDLDELLKTFDPRTRAALRTWMQSQGAAMDGRGVDLNVAFGELPGFADQMDQLAATLDSQGTAARKVISGTADFFDAISRRDNDLRTLVREGNRTFTAIGDRNENLAEIFRQFPRFEREATKTLPEVTDLANRGLPIVQRLQATATELTPTFVALKNLSPEFQGMMQQLGPLITASKDGLPGFDQILDEMPPVMQAFVPFTRTINPFFKAIDTGKQDFTSFVSNLAAASQWQQTKVDDDTVPNLVGPIHAVRVALTLSPEGLAYQSRPFGQSRRNAYMAPGGMNQLKTGLKSLTTGTCSNGDPIPPDVTDIPGQPERLKAYVFRTTGRDSARPPCVGQGNFPGFSTVFPQMHADPPVPVPDGQKAGGR